MNIKSMAAIGALGVGALVISATSGLKAAPNPGAQGYTCDGQDCGGSVYAAAVAAEMKAEMQALKANAVNLRGSEMQTLREQVDALRQEALAEKDVAMQEVHQGFGFGQGSGSGKGQGFFYDSDRPQTYWFNSDGPQGEEPGWLGVETEGVSADRAKDLKLQEVRGVYLSSVEDDSPAAKAGLKKGDVVLEFNGEHVEGTVQFRRLIREIPAGHTVQVQVWRDGKSTSISVKLGSADQDGSWSMATPMPAIAPVAPRAFSLNMPNVQVFAGGGMTPTIGISAEDLSGQLGSYFGAPDGEGVLITEVESGTPAEKAGMKAGDVVVKVSGERVRNIGEMRDRLRDKRDDKSVQVTVLRRGSEQNLTVEPRRPEATRSTMGRRATF